MGKLFIMTYGWYQNTDAVPNVIRYITRTRRNEDREKELIAWGSYNTLNMGDPEFVIKQFLDVQRCYGLKNRGGIRMVHHTFNLKAEEFYLMGNNPGVLYQFAMKCCSYYDARGHQVCFAMHESKEKGVHIHFAVNAYNYRTGLKWHIKLNEIADIDKLFNCFIQDYYIPELMENMMSPE